MGRGLVTGSVVVSLSAALLAALGAASAVEVCGATTQISENTEGNAVHPRLVVDSDRDATVAWFQIDGTRYNIWSNRFVSGFGWSGPVLIEEGQEDAFWPALAVDASGVVTAVWYQGGWAVYDIWSNRFVPGEGWQGAELVEDWAQGTAWDPDVAAGPDGRVAAVWKADNGSRTEVWAALYAPGSGWEQAVRVDDGAAGTPSDLHGDFDGADPFAVWRVASETGTSLWLNRYGLEAGWGTTLRTDEGTWASLLAHPWLGEPNEEPKAWSGRTWDEYQHVLSNLCNVPPPVSDPTITVDPLPASIAPGVLEVHGTAWDAVGIGLVEARVDGGPWLGANGTNAWTVRTPVGGGPHTLEARAMAVRGRTASVSVSFNVQVATGQGPPPPVKGEPPVEIPLGVPPVVPPTTPLPPDPGLATASPIVEDGGAPFGLSLVLVAGATALCGVVVWRGRREPSD